MIKKKKWTAGEVDDLRNFMNCGYGGISDGEVMNRLSKDERAKQKQARKVMKDILE